MEDVICDDAFRDELLRDDEIQPARMLLDRRWTIPAASSHVDELASRLRTSPIIAQILLNRGISDPDLCRDFLTPSLKLLHEPTLLPGAVIAAERIAQAIRD